MYKDYNDAVVTDTGLEALKNSIRNIILTKKGSLPGKPYFGSNLHKVIFSPMDTLTVSMVKTYIFESLTEFEPRIEIEEIQVKEVQEYNKLIINIRFTYRDSGFETDTASTSISINL